MGLLVGRRYVGNALEARPHAVSRLAQFMVCVRKCSVLGFDAIEPQVAEGEGQARSRTCDCERRRRSKTPMRARR